MDNITKNHRSWVMSRVKHKNTKPELVVKNILKSLRLSAHFQKGKLKLPGSPDIILPASKTAIFVHGCFWHGHRNCPSARVPKSNRGFWIKKVTTNQKRDQRVAKQLSDLGWKVLTIWECETKNRKKLESFGIKVYKRVMILDDLNLFKEELRKYIDSISKKISSREFDDKEAELLVLDFLKSRGHAPDHKPGSTRFPDIIVSKQNSNIGVEVKKISKSHSETLGNSSTQDSLHFKKIITVWFIGSWKNFQVRDYSEIVKTLVVDHNPRFKLSLESGKSAPFHRFLESKNISFYDFLALTVKKKNIFVKEFLTDPKYSSIESWRWFSGTQDDVALDFLKESLAKWPEVDKARAKIFLFAEHIEEFEGVELDETRLWVPLYKKFGTFGKIKDTFTAGRRSSHLPKICAFFLENLDTILQQVPKEKIPSWRKKAVEVFIRSKIGSTKSSTKNHISYNQAEEIELSIDAAIKRRIDSKI